MTITELVTCTDCALLIANDSADDEHRERVRAHRESAGLNGHLVIGEHTDDFSRTPCDVCGTHLAGDRWSAAEIA